MPSLKINHGITEEEINKNSSLLKEYLERIHARNQGFYTTIDNDEEISHINNFAKKVEGKYEDIVILGIGGSALGTICLRDSLKHLYENLLKERKHPRLHVLDNIDPSLLKQLDDIIDYTKTLFIVVTKSGSTPETISQYFYFRNNIDSKGLPARDHFAFITDPEKGLLREIANEEGIITFAIPENVGGRFSVLTPVSLLPAKLIGINIEKLLEGAKKMRDRFLNENTEENLPFHLAAIQHKMYQDGKVINVLMPYSQRLIKFADWYRQLLAESIGKEGKGITPINALGATDQHSQLQLYTEGPNDKLIIFIEVTNLGSELKIPNLKPGSETVQFLGNVTFNKLIATEMKATSDSLTQNQRPNITLTIPEVNEETLGQLFMLFEGATAFLGEFFNINAFDQPGVELSKNLTKEYLLKS